MNTENTLDQSHLDVIRLRNEGNNNTKIAEMLGLTANRIMKKVGQINKLSPGAIKVGMTSNDPEVIKARFEAKQVQNEVKILAAQAEEPNIIIIHSLLREAFPKLFNDDRLPLALGTKQVIIATGLLDDFTHLAINLSLKRWVRNKKYSRSCLNLKMRYSLEGEPVEEISEQDLQSGRNNINEAKKLKKLKARVEKKCADKKLAILKARIEKNCPVKKKERQKKHKAQMAQDKLNRAAKKAKHEAKMAKDAENKLAKIELENKPVEVAQEKVLKVKLVKVCKEKPLEVEPTKKGPVITIKKRRTLSLKSA